MRRRASRNFARILATFSALSLTCTLVAFYGSVSLTSEQFDFPNGESKSKLPLVRHQSKRHSGRTQTEEFDRDFHERGRALQGYAETFINGARSNSKQVFSRPIHASSLGEKESRFLTCNEIRSIAIQEELGHGYTKFVQRGIYKGRDIAVKSVQESSKDVQRCVKENRTSKAECFNLIKYKLAKEILILQQLQHSNIIKLLGFCWQNEVNSDDITQRGLTMVTELGQPLDVLSMLRLPWQERLRICLGLAKLIAFMETSPLGPLIIRDFRHPQFVLVSGEMKLSDLDDVDNEQHACASEDQCTLITANKNRTLPCRNRHCVGFNAAYNMINVCKYFMDHILIPGAPHTLQLDLQETMMKAQDLDLSSKELVVRLEAVVGRLRKGEHFVPAAGPVDEYRRIPEADFPALHDYYCDYSCQVGACEIAVGTLGEAKHQCSRDQNCKAFVVTESRTWLGHAIVYLKNNTTGLSFNKDTTAFIRIKR